MAEWTSTQGSGEDEPEIPLFDKQASSRPTSSSTQSLSLQGSAAPPVLASFAGLNSSSGPIDPPDPEIGVGNGSVVEVVNSELAIWTTGGALRATGSLPQFFDASTSDVTDPRIVFDPASGRWFASILDVEQASVRVAISQTGDPAGAWYVYANQPGACADQPSLGVSSSLVVIGYGGFTLPCRQSGKPTFLGGGYYVYNKSQLMSGGTAWLTYWNPNPSDAPIAPVKLALGPATAMALGDRPTTDRSCSTSRGQPGSRARQRAAPRLHSEQRSNGQRVGADRLRLSSSLRLPTPTSLLRSLLS